MFRNADVKKTCTKEMNVGKEKGQENMRQAQIHMPSKTTTIVLNPTNKKRFHQILLL
eukprot:m.76372 g.76372  ORF g.76372 m.76372 type:complete len:57 (+) comp17228_c1_seq3:272-442(+)